VPADLFELACSDGGDWRQRIPWAQFDVEARSLLQVVTNQRRIMPSPPTSTTASTG